MHQHRTSPYRKLHPVPLDNVHLKQGFWADRFEVCRGVMVPNMWEVLNSPQDSHAYANFRIAAGLEPGEHRGPKWNDGDFYKWLEAAAYVFSQTQDRALDTLMDEVIETIQRAQHPDGYIHTPVTIAARSGKPENAFQNRLHFETYNMGHLMTAACAHYRATGKGNLLRVANAAVGFLSNFYITARQELARNAICPSHYMGIIDLYRLTGETRYLELARNLVEIRDLVVDGGDDNQDRLPFRTQDRAVGHAVRANYLYAGVADVYMETGDPTLFAALEQLWTNVTATKMYVTGGCGALFDGASPDGAVDQSTITRVHQAYGREFQLPNVTAHNETCANIGNLLWNWRMLAITGDARYADILELVLYNSALVSINLDGDRFFYTNTLRQVDDLPFELRWGRTRQRTISCFCCPPNIVRTIAQVGSFLYSVSEEGIWVNLFAGSAASLALMDGTPVQLDVKTDYPWDGEVNLIVTPPVPVRFPLMVRIPGWCPQAALWINGKAADMDLQPGQYAKIERTWLPGDEVQMVLSMPAQWLESHPMVEETRNHLALRRGPLIYCLESVDLPDGIKVEEVAVSRQAAFEALSDPKFHPSLPGLRLIRGMGQVSDHGNWNAQLYRPARSKQVRPVPVQFIPYFAWDNRGKSEMTVWIPEI